MWLKLWKMSSLLLFVNIQSLLMARRWNRLWDNSLQFNSKTHMHTHTETKCKKKKKKPNPEVWISAYSLNHLCSNGFRYCLSALSRRWNGSHTILICWCASRGQENIFWPQKSLNFAIKIPTPPFPISGTIQPPRVLPTLSSYGTF